MTTSTPPQPEVPPHTAPIRIVIAEDSLLVREGIERLLERRDALDIVATCEDFPAVRAAVEAMEPHVLVTDIRMPPDQSDEGIRIANELRETGPTPAWSC